LDVIAATTYAALLRGINLGARNRVAMGDLRALVEGLGGKDVRTYVQSGNVVFGHGSRAATLQARLAEAIRRELRLEVAVLVRSAEELGKIVTGNPFLRRGAEPSELHLTLLASTPARARVRRLREADVGGGELEIAGREVYLNLPGGYGRSKLSNAFFEQRLGVPATTRNWRTVTALAELANHSR
jgi:uncharacterized protein (DUF1697 family)